MAMAAGLIAVRAKRVPLWVGALALFGLLFSLYLFSIDIRASWGASITGDEPFYLLTTQSLLKDGDLDTANQLASGSYESFFDHADGLWVQSVPREDGALLSPHNPGLSVLLLPAFAIGGLLGSQLQMVVFAAATFALAFLLVAGVTKAPLVSWGAVLSIALTAPAFVYASEIYPEVPTALSIVVVLVLVRSTGRVGPWRAAAILVALTAMPWLGVKYAPLAVVLAAYAIWRATPSARAVLLVGGGVSGVFYVWFHLSVFGGLTPYSLNLVYAGQSTVGIVGSHIDVFDRTYRLWGLFIDERFGIGRWAPVLLVGVAATPRLWKHGWAGQVVLVLIVAQLLSATFVAITMMGWWFPGRTLMAVLPLMALPLALVWMRVGKRTRWAIVGVAVYSATVTGALVLAGHARDIAVAVNPFDLTSPIYSVPGALFPDYTSWTLHTWAATGAWLSVMVVAAVSWWWRAGTRGTASESRPQFDEPMTHST